MKTCGQFSLENCLSIYRCISSNTTA